MLDFLTSRVTEISLNVPFPSEPPRPSGPATDTADRDAYRRGPSDEPKGGAGANFNPGFVSVIYFTFIF